MQVFGPCKRHALLPGRSIHPRQTLTIMQTSAVRTCVPKTHMPPTCSEREDKMRRTRMFGVVLTLGSALAIVACAPKAAPRATPPTAAAHMAMAALDVDPEDVYVRIVDVGPGLCAVIRIPGDRFMVYDAGHWNGRHCITAVRELVTTDTIDLMVISHSDADHLGDAGRILGEKRVRQTILAGEPRDTGSWTSLVNALAEEVKDGASVFNLQSVPLVPGRTIPLGEAVVTPSPAGPCGRSRRPDRK